MKEFLAALLVIFFSITAHAAKQCPSGPALPAQVAVGAVIDFNWFADNGMTADPATLKWKLRVKGKDKKLKSGYLVFDDPETLVSEVVGLTPKRPNTKIKVRFKASCGAATKKTVINWSFVTLPPEEVPDDVESLLQAQATGTDDVIPDPLPDTGVPAVSLLLRGSGRAGRPIGVRWSSRNVTSCTVFGPGDWKGARSVRGSERVVLPTNAGIYDFTITCTDDKGVSAADSESIRVR